MDTKHTVFQARQKQTEQKRCFDFDDDFKKWWVV